MCCLQDGNGPSILVPSIGSPYGMTDYPSEEGEILVDMDIQKSET